MDIRIAVRLRWQRRLSTRDAPQARRPCAAAAQRSRAAVHVAAALRSRVPAGLHTACAPHGLARRATSIAWEGRSGAARSVTSTLVRLGRTTCNAALHVCAADCLTPPRAMPRPCRAPPLLLSNKQARCMPAKLVRARAPGPAQSHSCIPHTPHTHTHHPPCLPPPTHTHTTTTTTHHHHHFRHAPNGRPASPTSWHRAHDGRPASPTSWRIRMWPESGASEARAGGRAGAAGAGSGAATARRGGAAT